MKLEKPCKQCGKVFTTYSNGLYCSSQCYYQAQREGKYKWQTDKRIKNKHTCSFCGKDIVKIISTNRNGLPCENVFCNKECYLNFKAKNIKVRKCKLCGKEFVAKGGKKYNVFCDDTCRRKYTALNTVNYCVICGQGFFPFFL